MKNHHRRVAEETIFYSEVEEERRCEAERIWRVKAADPHILQKHQNC